MATKIAHKWIKNVRSAWQLPREMTVSEWADKNRVLDPMTSAEPGQWHTDRTPYMREIMDSFTDSNVEDITLMFSTQVGKTEFLCNVLGYAIDQDPAPAMFVLPDENTAKDISKDRVQPMIRSSPALKSRLTPKKDDVTAKKITMDRMILYFGWSNSPASLASKPVRYLFMDEIDKYPKFSGREADPVKLATERTRTFWNRKIVKSSTPTTREGYIFREYNRSDKRRYYVPCPHCGKYQVLVWKQVQIPAGERDPETIKDRKLAWYECIKCKSKITDYMKTRIIRQGVWCPEGCSVNNKGKIRGRIPITSRKGYWLNALNSPWLTFSDVAAEFLSSQNSIEALMNFTNSWLAEVWEEKTEETTDKRINGLVIDYESGTVPDPVMVLTAGVDVQKDHFYYVIRGWGVGEESWLIRAVRVESWEQIISDLFMTEYVKSNGERLSIRMTCIDSGYRTDEVYEVCRSWADIACATKGEMTLGGIPYKVSTLDKNIDGSPVKFSIKLWRLDTYFFKDKITRMIQSGPDDPAQFHIHKNPSPDYVKHMTSEHKIIIRDRKSGRAREVWKTKTTGAQNHLWDCEVGATAAAQIIHVSTLRRDSEMIPHKTPRAPKRKGQWVRGRKGWLKR